MALFSCGALAPDAGVSPDAGETEVGVMREFVARSPRFQRVEDALSQCLRSFEDPALREELCAPLLAPSPEEEP